MLTCIEEIRHREEEPQGRCLYKSGPTPAVSLKLDLRLGAQKHLRWSSFPLQREEDTFHLLLSLCESAERRVPSIVCTGGRTTRSRTFQITCSDGFVRNPSLACVISLQGCDTANDCQTQVLTGVQVAVVAKVSAVAAATASAWQRSTNLRNVHGCFVVERVS